MTVVNPEGIADAVVQLLRDATWTQTPAIIDVGDLSYYPENPVVTADLPAIFVRGLEMPIDNDLDVGGEEIQQEMLLRVLYVQDFDLSTQNVERLKFQRSAELAQAFIRGSGYDYRLDQNVSGVTIERVTLTKVEFAPPEHADVVQVAPVQNRRLFALAMNVVVLGRATR